MCRAPQWLGVFGAWCAVLVWVHRVRLLSLSPHRLEVSVRPYPSLSLFSTGTASASSRRNRKARCTAAWPPPPLPLCNNMPIRSGRNLQKKAEDSGVITFQPLFYLLVCQQDISKYQTTDFNEIWTDKPLARGQLIWFKENVSGVRGGLYCLLYIYKAFLRKSHITMRLTLNKGQEQTKIIFIQGNILVLTRL